MNARVAVMGLLVLQLIAGAFAQDAPKRTAQDSTTPKSTIHNVGFHGIAVGQPISALPNQFHCGAEYCDGIVWGSFVSVSVWKSTVGFVDVIYQGVTRSFKISHIIERPTISLAQAVRLHSLQTGARVPVLRYAGESDFVDVANRIVYMTAESTPSLTPEGIGKNRVKVVTYIFSGYPKLALSNSESLGLAQASLLADAKIAPLYSPPSAKLPLILSGYMRDVGLLYIESVESAVGVMTDSEIPFDSRGDRSEARFKLVKALDDRIEIHVESKADKEFYERGLQRLRTLGQLDASTIDLSFVLIERARLTQNPDDKTRADECSRIAQAKTKLYITCDTEVRTIIKNGEYDPDKLLDRCYLPDTGSCGTGAALPQIPTPPQTANLPDAMKQQATVNSESAKASPAAAAALAHVGHQLTPEELAQLVKDGQASRCAVLTIPSGAEVYVDSNMAGVSPLVFVLLKQGDTPRTVTIRMNGYKTVEKKFIPDGKTIPIGLTLEKNSQ